MNSKGNLRQVRLELEKRVIFKEYFGGSNILGLFEPGQAVRVIESQSRFRYQKQPIQILYDNKGVYCLLNSSLLGPVNHTFDNLKDYERAN